MSDVPAIAWNSAKWHKSSKSASNGCLEVAFLAEWVAVRDSKNRHGPILSFTLPEWKDFIGGVRKGEFDQE